MTDRFRGRLSEYLDGELAPDDHRLVERHLEGCQDCAHTLAQLEAVVEQAQRLAGREPEGDLWPAIAARLGEQDEERLPATFSSLVSANSRRRISLSIPQLAAAVIVLASVSGGTAWLARSGPAIGTAAGPGDAPGQLVSTAPATANSAEVYAASIAELEQALFDPARPLPAQTEARVRRALVTIDRAIEDARQALLEVPDDPYLQEHMTSTMRRKSDFLERAVRLAAQS